MNEIIGDYHEAVAKINSGLVKAGIDRHELSILDHLCYRLKLRDFGISVKFHRLSLGSVVMIEDKLANS